MRRILLHIGSPKCGSTYLQEVMRRNSAALSASGILYPHDGAEHPGNAAGLATLQAEELERFFSAGTRTLVLSHEDLFHAPFRGAPFAALTRQMGIAVRPFAFLRPFSDFAYADYSQYMKQFLEPWLASRMPYDGLDFEAFAKRRRAAIRPAAYLRDWAALFPDAPLLVASHDDLRPVLEDLLGLAAVTDWTVPPDRVNRSLSIAECEAIARAMRDPARPAEEIRQMMRVALAAPPGPDRGRTPKRTALLETLYAEETAAILQAHGYDNRRRDAKKRRRWWPRRLWIL